MTMPAAALDDIAAWQSSRVFSHLKGRVEATLPEDVVRRGSFGRSLRALVERAPLVIDDQRLPGGSVDQLRFVARGYARCRQVYAKGRKRRLQSLVCLPQQGMHSADPHLLSTW